MNIVVRKNISCKLKNPASEIGYYSYTNRSSSLKNTQMNQQDSKLCKLCLKKTANQTGSHLTSCFIVASQLGKRGSEKGFLITADPNQDYSKNLEAEGIKEDDILCSGCEKRLSFIENYFSQELTNKIDKERFKINFPEIELGDDNNSKYIQCTNINPIAFHLLIYSIIWRASLSDKPIFSGFSLEESVMENLRFKMDLYLPEFKNRKIIPKLKEWLKDLTDVPDFFTMYPYMILKSEEKEINIEELSEKERWLWEKRKTANPLYFAFEDNHPYHIILNEFIILAFFNKNEINFSNQDYFELNGKYDLEGQMNKEIEMPKIGILKNEDWYRILIKLNSSVRNKRLDNTRKWCIEYYLKKGIIPTKRLVEECTLDKINQIKIKGNDEEHSV